VETIPLDHAAKALRIIEQIDLATVHLKNNDYFIFPHVFLLSELASSNQRTPLSTPPPQKKKNFETIVKIFWSTALLSSKPARARAIAKLYEIYIEIISMWISYNFAI
jgi:hypothetical protein